MKLKLSFHKDKLSKKKDAGFIVYQKKPFGDEYPCLSKEEKKELDKLFPNKRKKKNVMKDNKHPDFVYKAIDISNKYGL